MRRGRQKTGDLSLQVVMVAGACNQRYLQLWSGAARLYYSGPMFPQLFGGGTRIEKFACSLE